MSPYRSLAAALAVLASAAGVAACGGERQTRDGNPGVEDQRLDQRRDPSQTPAPTEP